MLLPIVQAGENVMLGLSGGRDSVALLHLLGEQGCSVFARHLHHGIRGQAADEDAQFCRELCERLGINYDEKRVNIPQLAREAGESIELCARRVRRAYLIQQARACNCPNIALAQHADDQAETVIFRMARGAAGPRAMQAKSQEEGITIIRPLLQTRRVTITSYLQNKGESWRDDQSNESSEHTRNALRHKVLPAYAAAMGRDIVPILNRSARLQGETALALGNALELLQSHFYDPQGRLYLPALRGSSPELARAVLQDYLKRQQIGKISNKLIEQLEQLISPESPKSSLNLAGGKQIKRKQQRLFVIEG